MRTCTKCGVTKELDCFYTSRGVHYPSCKDCPAIVGRALMYLRYYETVQIDQLHEVVVGRNGHNRV